MEIIDAETIIEGEDHFLKINTDPLIKIPISTDNAKEVKSAFCDLIEQLRKGVFKIKLKETEKDLFYFVASEYIDQLNGEIKEICEEMKQDGLLILDGDKS